MTWTLAPGRHLSQRDSVVPSRRTLAMAIDSTTPVAASTVLLAAEAARDKALQVAARQLEASFNDLVLEDGRVTVRGVPSAGIELGELARTFNLNQWGEALHAGAFDVLDVLCDLPKAAEAARRALGTDYLKRFRGHHEGV